jgi:hypothetical protein
VLQLEFLSIGFPQSPFLRISGEDVRAATLVKQAFADLAQRRRDHMIVSDLPGIAAIDGCRVTAAVGNQNRGVVQLNDGKSFEWILTPAGWDNNVGLMEPFCEACAGHSYQWLDSPSGIAVLFSPSGQW